MATQREFDGRLFSESVEALTIATGTKLSRYEIRSKIGEGGMAKFISSVIQK